MDSMVAMLSLAMTTLVSLGLFVWQLVVNRKQAQRQAQERALEQMIDVLTLAVRRLDRPAFLRPWFKPEMEFALVFPRLILRLSKSDTIVGQWAARQVQLIQRAGSDREAARIGITMTSTLTEWHLGLRSRSWFADQMTKSPWDTSAISLRTRLKRQASRTGDQLLAIGGLLIAVSIVAFAGWVGLRTSGTAISEQR